MNIRILVGAAESCAFTSIDCHHADQCCFSNDDDDHESLDGG